MGYLINDIVTSFGLSRVLKGNSPAYYSVKYACESKLKEGEDYTKNSDGSILINDEGTEKLRKYYVKRKLIKGNEKIYENESMPTNYSPVSLKNKKVSVVDSHKGTGIIYGLQDPETNEMRYVGRTTSIIQRYRKHRIVTHQDIKENKQKSEWILSLQSKGLNPYLVILEICKQKQIVEREKAHIDYFLEKGARLLNIKYGDEYQSQLTTYYNYKKTQSKIVNKAI